MAKMCTVSRLERQFVHLVPVSRAYTGGGGVSESPSLCESVLLSCFPFLLQKSFGNPNPYSSRRKYSSTPPICTAVPPPHCIAGPSWLRSLEERETQQYTSHLYCSTPPICTAVRLPFVRKYFWEVGVTGRLLTVTGMKSYFRVLFGGLIGKAGKSPWVGIPTAWCKA